MSSLTVSALVVLSSLTSLAAFADGTLIGDGGDAVRCERSDINEFEGYYSLDFLVTFTGDRSYYADVVTAEGSVDEILTLVELKLPTISPSLQNFTHHILNADWTRERIWEARPFGLLDLADEALIELVPMNCREEADRVSLVQAVNRQDAETAGVQSGKVVYHYVPDVFDDIRATDEMQLSFLMIHEWLWDLSDNVARNRRINRFLHSRDFRTMTADEVKAQLVGMGLEIPMFPVEPVPLEYALDVQSSYEFSCGLKAGRVHCFGSNLSGQTDVPDDLRPIQQLAVTDAGSTCALDVDGEVRCWGSHHLVPAPSLGHVSSLHAGTMACATTAMGVQCWRRGRMVSDIPTNLPLDSADDVAIGEYHGCHIKDGTVSCWGDEDLSAVSDVPTSFRGPKRVFAGVRGSCAFGYDGLQCWGIHHFDRHWDDLPDFRRADLAGVHLSNHHETLCAVFGSTVGCWMTYGSRLIPQAVPPLHGRRIKKLDVGNRRACVVSEIGVECWDLSESGNAQIDRDVPDELTAAR